MRTTALTSSISGGHALLWPPHRLCGRNLARSSAKPALDTAAKNRHHTDHQDRHEGEQETVFSDRDGVLGAQKSADYGHVRKRKRLAKYRTDVP